MNTVATAIANHPVFKDHVAAAHQRGRLQIGDAVAANPQAQALLNKLAGAMADILKSGGPNPATYAALAAWFASVSHARTEGLLTQANLQYLRSACGPAVGPGTMQGRSILQKYGYAGDFEIIDEIYRNVVTSDPALKGWDEFYQAQAVPTAVRKRKAYFKQLVSETLAANPQGVEVLHIASGPCRDIAEFFEGNPMAKVRFTCVDVDERAIAYAKKVCSPWLDRITFIRSNGLRMRLDKKFDLVWCAGLFDYLHETGFVALLSRLIGFAKPEAARVVVGSFVDPNPCAAYLEFADWFLKYRSQEKLLELALACGVAASAAKVEREEAGINLFLRITVGSPDARSPIYLAHIN